MKQITFLIKCNRKTFSLLALIMLFGQANFAQQKPLILQATSKNVSIKDGEVYQKDIWNLSPEIKPDIYYALMPTSENRITFYTDIDSISLNTVPEMVYDFIILLNSKDSCYTQVSTIKPVKHIETPTVSLDLIAPAMLKQDFTLFRKSLQKDHAGLYRYKSKKELDKIFDSCFVSLNHPMSPLEFAKSIMFVISALEDGHTRTNVTRLLMNYYSENKAIFPLYPHFIDNKAYVLCGNVKELPAGTEILSINNQSVHEIAKEIFRYLPSDGNIQTKKRQILNDGAFPIMYHWIFGDKNSFSVKYRNKNGTTGTATIAAKLMKDFECEYQNKSGNAKPLQLDFPQNNTASLTIKSFDSNRINGAQLDFGDFLEASFKEINSRKVSHLIIDVRGNGGGDDNYGALLYSYLTSKPFRYFASKATTTTAVALEENPLLGPQQAQNNNFKGKVSILINGLSFSTTADFCATARSNNRGIFIGEETGGGYYGNTSGGNTEVKLPNSNISVMIPLFKYVNAVKTAPYKDRGIIPDYIVIPTIDEILAHKDAELAIAYKLAEK